MNYHLDAFEPFHPVFFTEIPSLSSWIDLSATYITCEWVRMKGMKWNVRDERVEFFEVVVREWLIEPEKKITFWSNSIIPSTNISGERVFGVLSGRCRLVGKASIFHLIQWAQLCFSFKKENTQYPEGASHRTAINLGSSRHRWLSRNMKEKKG